MIKETYERLLMDVTEFDTEDVITTSGEGGGDTPGGGGSGESPDHLSSYELPLNL